jgi:hypothetical protein
MTGQKDEQVVRTRRHGLRPESRREEGDMAGLVLGNLREAAANPGREAGLLERRRIELIQSLVVESVLEVLQGERVLEDNGV